MFEILISIIVAVCYGISATIQKYSFAEMKKFSIRKMIKNKIWIVSLLIGGAGLLIYLLSLRFIQLSTIQPILALTIIIPIVSGVLIFREKISLIELISIVLIVVGVIWISL